MVDNVTRVMVVGGSAAAVAELVALLGFNGYLTRSSTDVAEALSAISEFEPHCVLFDARLPRLGGLEFAHHLRQRYGDDVILVAITADAPDDEQIAVVLDLADHYLTQPIPIEQFQTILPRMEG